MRHILFVLILAAAGTAWAQLTLPPQPAPTNIDPPGELDKIKENCGTFSKIGGCFEQLFTGQPLHIAVGSIAPQNGYGAGLAYVGLKNTENWRITWNADAVGSNNASWRAGFYMKLVDTRGPDIGFHMGTQGTKVKPNHTGLPEHPVINLYAQTISLNKLTYFGLGPNTNEAGRSFYGMRQTIVGASGVKPVNQRLNVALYGEANGRFVSIRPSDGQPSPSIEQVYTEAAAPGLTHQPSFIQFGEGIRMHPVLANDVVRLNYDLAYRQYVAPGDSTFSFQRLTVDLSNQFALHSATTRWLLPRDANGPDECSLVTDPKHPECTLDKKAQYDACMADKSKKPSDCKAITRDLQGSFGLRFFLALSMTPGGDVVPFYFQPTIGGSDVNGNASLTSYQDYRFRAPNVLLFRQSFEHSIWGPLGFTFMVDEGKVALTRGGLGSSNWVHSFSSGLTLRLGGIPQVSFLFSWGGNEGTHTIVNQGSSLLGGSARPSLN
ncbi:MAG: hypothetical protein LAQ69_37010 [Acidobacteriia bacterium]|nr:hypothetical protein [Terriglobia bacterium]